MRVGWSGVDRYTSDCILGRVQLFNVGVWLKEREASRDGVKMRKDVEK